MLSVLGATERVLYYSCRRAIARAHCTHNPLIGKSLRNRYRLRAARCSDINPNNSGITVTRSNPRAASFSATPRAPG